MKIDLRTAIDGLRSELRGMQGVYICVIRTTVLICLHTRRIKRKEKRNEFQPSGSVKHANGDAQADGAEARGMRKNLDVQRESEEAYVIHPSSHFSALVL